MTPWLARPRLRPPACISEAHPRDQERAGRQAGTLLRGVLWWHRLLASPATQGLVRDVLKAAGET